MTPASTQTQIMWHIVYYGTSYFLGHNVFRFLSFHWLIHICIIGSEDRHKDYNQENESSSSDDDDYNNFDWEFDQQLVTSHQVI